MNILPLRRDGFNIMQIHVAVVFGGKSVEHEISILSAMQVIAAMPEKYSVLPIYISKEGRLYCDSSFTEVDIFKNLANVCLEKYEVQFVKKYRQVYIKWNQFHILKAYEPIDFVLPILHGTNGEDGNFQGFLKTLDIPFGFSDVLSTAITQDKVAMKMILQDRGLPITPWFYWYKYQSLDENLYAKASRLGYPMIVKPSNLGSSVGIMIANDGEMLKEAIENAFQYDDKVVIEKLITPLQEFNISVKGNAKKQSCSVIEEVKKDDCILSYQDKYEKENISKGMASASRIIPAYLCKEEEEQIKEYALSTFQVLHAEGVVRIDFLMNAKTRDLYVNEMNSIPGSMAYYLWEASGTSFTELIDDVISLGIERYRNQHKLIYTFDTNVLQKNNKQGIKK